MVKASDPHQRMSAQQALNHPWFTAESHVPMRQSLMTRGIHGYNDTEHVTSEDKSPSIGPFHMIPGIPVMHTPESASKNGGTRRIIVNPISDKRAIAALHILRGHDQ